MKNIHKLMENNTNKTTKELDRDTVVILTDLIDKHMQETVAVIDYQYELDKLKEKYAQVQQ